MSNKEKSPHRATIFDSCEISKDISVLFIR